MNIIPIKTPLFQEGDDLSKFIFGAIVEIIDKSVVVVTSKIVALSQNAVAPIEAKNKLIYKNSKQVIKTPWTLMALVNNEWCANAGIDESNTAHGIILLPKKTHGYGIYSPTILAEKTYTKKSWRDYH